MNILGLRSFVDILGGLSRNWTGLGVISMLLWSFLKVNVQSGDNFWLKFQIFLGYDFFLVNSRCWVQAYL